MRQQLLQSSHPGAHHAAWHCPAGDTGVMEHVTSVCVTHAKFTCATWAEACFVMSGLALCFWCEVKETYTILALHKL